jgi:protein-tyrosine phosphatase
MQVCAGFPNSYWVIPGVFAAGEYPGAVTTENAAVKLAHLLEAGIDLFVDLTEENELEPYDAILLRDAAERDPRVTYMRMPIVDMNVPMQDEMAAILDAIDSAVSAGRRVYLHCWGGIGRTGTVVGCYLVRHGYTGADALQRVAELFSVMPKSVFYRSPQTDAQCTFVREWVETDSATRLSPDASAR